MGSKSHGLVEKLLLKAVNIYNSVFLDWKFTASQMD